jgi:tetratricopeptide (TPR) repeat protein
MYRSFRLPISAAIALLLFAACRNSDRSKTISESTGSQPVVSTDSSTETGSVAAIPVPVTYESGEAAFRAGHYEDAARILTSYTESNPDNAWGHYMLGLAAWRAGDPSQSIKSFDRAIELDPNHRKSFFNSARVLLETGKAGDALERIEKGLALEPMSNEGLRLLGRAKYQLGRADEAIEAYHRALGLDETDVWSMNNLGLIYLDQGKSEEALPPLARAVEIKSNSPVFQNNLGTALERSGYPVAAAKAYEAALTADSGYTKASVSLARVTSVTQTTDSESIDLGGLAAKFEDQISEWRGPITPIDSTASIQAQPDSVEDCAIEEQ